MRIDITQNPDKPGFYTITPHGPIDSETHEEFVTRVHPLLSPKTRGILVDLKDVDYISSAGLGALFTIKKFMLAKNSDLLFCNLKPQIKQLFEIIKALPKETIFTNTEEADRYFYKIMNDEIEKQRKKS